MALLPILKYPDSRLHTVAVPVREVDEAIQSLVDDMAETMYAAPGIGLAATQVDVHKQVIVLDISESKDELLVLINPEIVTSSGQIECEEGCLSVPGIFEKVTRAEEIRVRALDRDGNTFEFDASGLLSVCVQHEMDHLKGKVFVEYLSPLKQERIVKKLRKAERLAI
ncbi:MAG: peptide deformylase [Betaproteobacteria bacterium]|nr:MAG: peptide deformylase [Betaproteobacteria bacterium]